MSFNERGEITIDDETENSTPTQESLNRVDTLNRFRDQENVGKDENIPVSEPSLVQKSSYNVFDGLDSEEKLVVQQSQPTEVVTAEVPKVTQAMPPQETKKDNQDFFTNQVTPPQETKKDNQDFFTKQVTPPQETKKDNQDFFTNQAMPPQETKRDNQDFFTKQVTPPQEDTNYAAHQETVKLNDTSNEGIFNTKPLSEKGQDFFARQDEVAKEAKKDAAHQETVKQNAASNEGIFNTKPLSENGQDFFARQDQIAQEAKKDASHEQALNDNKEANKGVPANAPLSDTGKSFFARQDEIAQQAKKEATHQAALDSNEKANEGFKPLSPLSSTGQNFFARQDDIAEKARKDTPHQEALDSNAKANEGFIATKPLSNTGKTFFQREDIYKEKAEADNKVEELTDRVNDLEFEVQVLKDQIARLQEGKEPEPVVIPTPAPKPPEVIPIPSPQITVIEPLPLEQEDELTPEQRSTVLANQLAEYWDIMSARALTDEEKIKYFDLMLEKRNLDRQIHLDTVESERKRTRKEEWVKIAAGAAGFGTAMATPAIGVGAVLAVTLGGPAIGRGMKGIENKLRSKANALKYELRSGKSKEEVEKLDRKQKRTEWWANRFGEVSAVVSGGTVGYGAGKMIQNIFGWGQRPAPAPSIETATPAAGNTGAPLVENTPVIPESTPVVEAPSTPMGTPDLPPAPEAGWLTGDSFSASELGWDYRELGWIGDKVALGPQGGSEGLLQKDFFSELSKLVPKEQLIGAEAGSKVNSFLIDTYRGVDPAQAARQAAETLLGK